MFKKKELAISSLSLLTAISLLSPAFAAQEANFLKKVSMNKQDDNSIEVNLFLKDKLPSRPLVFERGKNVYFISLPATVYSGPRKIDISSLKDEISNVTIDFVSYKTSKNSGYTRIIIETKNKTKITIKDTVGLDAQALGLLILKILSMLAAAGLLAAGAFWGYKKFVLKKNLDNLLDVDEVYIENAQSESAVNSDEAISEIDTTDAEILNFVDNIDETDDIEIDNEQIDVSTQDLSMDISNENIAEFNDVDIESDVLGDDLDTQENNFVNSSVENDILEAENHSEFLQEELASDNEELSEEFNEDLQMSEPLGVVDADVKDENFSQDEFVSDMNFYPTGDEIVSDILNNEEAISELADAISDDIIVETTQEFHQNLADEIIDETKSSIANEFSVDNYSSVDLQANSQVGMFAPKSFSFEQDVNENISTNDENLLEELPDNDVSLFEEFIENNDVSEFIEDSALTDEILQNANVETSDLEDTIPEDLLEIFTEQNDTQDETNTDDFIEEDVTINPFDSFVADVPLESEILHNEPKDTGEDFATEDLSEDDSIFDELIQEAQDNSDISIDEAVTYENQEFADEQISSDDDFAIESDEQVFEEFNQNEILQSNDLSEENFKTTKNPFGETIDAIENTGVEDNLENNVGAQEVVEFLDNEPDLSKQEQEITEIQLDTNAFFKEEEAEVTFINEDVFYKDEEEYNFASEIVEPEELFKDDTPEFVDDSEPLVISNELIDTEKNLYLIRHNGEYSLVGMVGENVFVLNKFSQVPTKDKIHVKLNETKNGQNIYIVKVDSWRALIAVDENGMENILTLS